MARPRTEESTKEQARFSFQDMMDLKEELKDFQQKRINGALISPFDQWLVGQNIRRVSDDGALTVFYEMAGRDSHYGKVNAALELWECNQQEKDRGQFPELHEAFLKKFLRKKIEV